MAKTLFVLNDPPYGTERSYNALRLAGSSAKREGEYPGGTFWSRLAQLAASPTPS